MRSSFATQGRLLRKTPSVRQAMRRRRLAIIAATLGLAAMSGLIGALSQPRTAAIWQPTTGPFSYTPTQ